MGFSLSGLFGGGGFNPVNVFGGDKGDIFSNLVDPGGSWVNNITGDENDYYSDLSNWADDVADTNEYMYRNRWNNFRKDDGVLRSLVAGDMYTAGSPWGTKLGNEIYGREDKPLWDTLGDTTTDDYRYAESQGQDTSNQLGVRAVGSGIGKGFLNAFTFGLGSTVADGLDNWGYDQSNDDLWKTAAANYLGNQYAGNIAGSNVAGSAGVSTTYQPLVNNTIAGAARGGISQGVQGNSITQGSLDGGMNAFANTGGNMAFDGISGMFNNDTEMDIFDPRNTGTLGGTVENQYGERSSPGMLIPEQAQANAQANPGLNTGFQLPTDAGMKTSQNFSPAVQAYMNAVQPQGNAGGGQQAQGGGYGDLAASLFGAYNAFNQRKDLRNQQRQLQDLFSPNSPYAQHARQRMERKDAAAGRRSQYGPREAHIAALLADRQAQTFPTQMKYQEGIGKMDNAFLANLLRGGSNAYKQAPKIGNDLESGLNWLMNLRGGQ